MNQLVGTNVTNEQIKDWAYNNRITVSILYFEEEFSPMKKSVEGFMHSDSYSDDEFKNWDLFLEEKYIQ